MEIQFSSSFSAFYLAKDFGKTGVTNFRQISRIGNVPFILFMGRLDFIKGPDLLLQAYSKVQQTPGIQHHLVFAGPNSGMLATLKKMVTNLGLENKIHFVGFLDNELKNSAYFESDLLVIPSRKEAMSIVVLEAGITHTPVLLTDRCGFGIVSEINGGKVVPATIEGLTQGLIDILSEPRDLKIMGENLYSFVSSEYSWEKVALKHIELYNTILSGNDLPSAQTDKDKKGKE